MDTSTTTDNQPTRQAVAVVGRSGKLTVSGKLRVAVDAMIWQGLRRDAAAASAGITDHGLRTALSKPHVRAYYSAQLEVLRTSERARNIHALVEVRDSKTNQMATVAAVKTLEQLSDSPGAVAPAGQAPGVVIVINNTSAPAALIPHELYIDANPLITNGSVHDQ
jgi:hypothetical protein